MKKFFFAISLFAFSSSLALGSGFQQYKCEELSPTGKYKVTIHLKEDAFGKLRAQVHHQDLQTGVSALTTTVGGCSQGGPQIVSCNRGGRSFIIFFGLSAQYNGTGGLRDLRCFPTWTSRD
jgi:hypothetical protein